MKHPSLRIKAPCPRHSLAVAVAAAFGVLCAGAAAAQEKETLLKETTVSSEADKPVQARTELGKLSHYAPLSGAVVDKGELDHLQLGNGLLELGKRVPGISMIRNMRIPDGNKQYTENRIDGMRSTGVTTSLLDEVDLADIERIEVITGPGSALYGSGALGGTISVFTRQPPREFEAKLSQETGSWGFQRTQANVGTSFADGRASFIVTGSNMDNDGWRKSSAPGAQDAAAEHKRGQTLRAQFRPTDSTNITAGYGELRYDYRWAGPLRMTKFTQDWRQVEAGTFGQYIDDYKTTSFRLQQLVGDRGEFTLAQMRIANAGLNNGNGGSGGANNVICDNVTVTCTSVNNGSTTVTNTIKQSDVVTKTTLAMYRQEFDAAKTTAYVGTEVIDISSDTSTYNNNFTALQGQSGLWAKGAMVTKGEGSLSTTKETTPFVHVEFSPVDKLRFHLGERFGSIDYDVDDRTSSNKDVKMTRGGNVLRSGVTYELHKSHVLWGNWGETFNPQTTSSLVNSATLGDPKNVIGQVLSPERGVTQEIGVRGLFPEQGLRYDLTYYQADTKGFITTRACTTAEKIAYNAGAACTLNEAAGGLATNGLESRFAWAVKPWLDLGATYTAARAYFTNYKTTSFDYTGKDYQAMPTQRLNLRVGVKPAPGWLVELEGDYISNYYIDNENSDTYSRPSLFNLRASYRSKTWSFWLHALNLTDQQYATRMQKSTIAGVSSVLSSQAGQGNAGSYTPLTLRVGVSYNF